MFNRKNEYFKDILLVEDDPDLIDMEYEALSKYFNVIKATSGTEAITKFTNQRFDLIILDFHLPKLNADRILIELNKISIQLKKTLPKLIVLTGDKERAEENLSNEKKVIILEKPFSLKILCKLCLKVLNQE